MSPIAEAEILALSLNPSDRAKLADKLIASLPSPADADGDWVAEALRRDRQIDENPNTAVSAEELFSSLRNNLQ